MSLKNFRFAILLIFLVIFFSAGLAAIFSDRSTTPSSEEVRLRNIVAKAHTAEIHRIIWKAYKDSPLREKAFFLITDWFLARINCATSRGEIQGLFMFDTHEGVLFSELQHNYETSAWLRTKMNRRIDEILKRAQERVHEFEVESLEKQLEIDTKK